MSIYKRLLKELKEHPEQVTYFLNLTAEKFSSPCFWLMMVACSCFVISSFPSIVIFITVLWFLTEILAAVFQLVFCCVEFHPVSIISVWFLSVWCLAPPLCLRVMVPHLHVFSTF